METTELDKGTFKWVERFQSDRISITNKVLEPSDHFMNRIIFNDIAKKLATYCGSAYSITHDNLRYHRTCSRWVPKQLKMSIKRNVWKHTCNFCSDIMKKERLFCNELSQAMKRRCTTMNLVANVKAWSRNTCHRPG
jgi:hypothetical protein